MKETERVARLLKTVSFDQVFVISPEHSGGPKPLPSAR
jgi:hypothetical protein